MAKKYKYYDDDNGFLSLNRTKYKNYIKKLTLEQLADQYYEIKERLEEFNDMKELILKEGRKFI